MVQITIEYMILTPALILMIFLLPFTANAIMNTHVESRQKLELQNVASNLASTIQQIYFSLNHESVAAGSISANLEIPPLLESRSYLVNGTSRTALDTGATIVDLTLRFAGGAINNASVTLGKNAQWGNSSFRSDSLTSYMNATKLSNNTIQISFMP